MPKIARKTAKIFAENSATLRVAQIGSLRAGTPNYSKDLDVLQALANFTDGWPAVAMGDNSPALEDVNALDYVLSYQIAYLLQNAGAEWNATTEYFQDSICAFNGILMVSLQNSNLGNNPATAPTYWAVHGSRVTTLIANTTLNIRHEIVRCAVQPPGPTMVITLPSVAAMPVGKTFTIKNVSTGVSGGIIAVTAAVGQQIDLTNVVNLGPATMSGPQESITIVNNGTSWDIV